MLRAIQCSDLPALGTPPSPISPRVQTLPGFRSVSPPAASGGSQANTQRPRRYGGPPHSRSAGLNTPCPPRLRTCVYTMVVPHRLGPAFLARSGCPAIRFATGDDWFVLNGYVANGRRNVASVDWLTDPRLTSSRPQRNFHPWSLPSPTSTSDHPRSSSGLTYLPAATRRRGRIAASKRRLSRAKTLPSA